MKKKKVEMIESADSTAEDKIALPYGITQSDIFGTSSPAGDSSGTSSASDPESTHSTQQLSESTSVILSPSASTSNVQ